MLFTFCRCSFAKTKKETKKASMMFREEKVTEEIGRIGAIQRSNALTVLIFDRFPTHNNKNHTNEKNRMGIIERTTRYCFNCVIDGIITTIIIIIWFRCGTPKMIRSIKIVHVTNGIRRVHFSHQKLMWAIIQFHLDTTWPTPMTAYKVQTKRITIIFFFIRSWFFLLPYYLRFPSASCVYRKQQHAWIEWNTTHRAESSSEWFEHKRSAAHARVRVCAIVWHTLYALR